MRSPAVLQRCKVRSLMPSCTAAARCGIQVTPLGGSFKADLLFMGLGSSWRLSQNGAGTFKQL